MHTSNGLFMNNQCSNEVSDNTSCNQNSILAKMNKYVIENYVQSVLSGLNMNEYYQKDISQLPIPLSRPVSSDIKGSNNLENPLDVSLNAPKSEVIILHL